MNVIGFGLYLIVGLFELPLLIQKGEDSSIAIPPFYLSLFPPQKESVLFNKSWSVKLK